MSPEYFHERLTYGEADDYLGGMHRRCHHGYSQARMITTIIGKLFAKGYEVPVFPWEEKRKAEDQRPPTEEEMKEILAEARKWEEELNTKKDPSPALPSMGGSGYK
jgi:hypothetical protein